MLPLHTDNHNWRYRALIGAGGIGSGMFFALDHNHTLEREESRSGRILDQQDYCKLHIISHYVQTLMGAPFHSLPVGKVGDDEAGVRLLAEMQAAGLDTHFVGVCPDARTLFSFCFLYPDGSGGNLTSSDSASQRVNPGDVLAAESMFAEYRGRGIALAVPEAPLEVRRKILELGTLYHFYRVASFSAEEMEPALGMGLLQVCDLLAVNLGEALHAAGLPARAQNPQAALTEVIERIRRYNPALSISITAGALGAWLWDGQALLHRPALPTRLVSSAGAGDAFLAGILVGLAVGLNPVDAQELGALTAAFSLTSAHTIAKNMSKESLRNFAREQGLSLSASIEKLVF